MANARHGKECTFLKSLVQEDGKGKDASRVNLILSKRAIKLLLVASNLKISRERSTIHETIGFNECNVIASVPIRPQ